MWRVLGVGDGGSCAEGAQVPFQLPPVLSLENYSGALLASVAYSWLLLSSWLCIFSVTHMKETLHVERKKRGRYTVSEWHRNTVIKISIVKSIGCWFPYFCRFLDRTTIWTLLHFLIYREHKMSGTMSWVLFLNQIEDLAGAYMIENTQQSWAE